jgi:hypothetical protein
MKRLLCPHLLAKYSFGMKIKSDHSYCTLCVIFFKSRIALFMGRREYMLKFIITEPEPMSQVGPSSVLEFFRTERVYNWF